jgi:hydroxymethylpyrimidine/phosphomethylpyrimidine kinase
MSSKSKKGQPIVLSIAGYDPSSGAGITADIKTIAAHGCYAITCITALTVQSTQGVKRVESVDTRIITETLEELAADFPITAVKIGMLGTVEAVRAVAAFLRRNHFAHVVLDPVLQSSSGMELLSREGIDLLRDRLISLTGVITPNLDEASVLTDLPVTSMEEMKAAAQKLHALGAKDVIITGGHLDEPVDVISTAAGRKVKLLKGKKVSGPSTHGTGCAFSAALACNLALGHDLCDAAIAAKQYVTMALRTAKPIGKGRGPINHPFKAISK